MELVELIHMETLVLDTITLLPNHLLCVIASALFLFLQSFLSLNSMLDFSIVVFLNLQTLQTGPLQATAFQNIVHSIYKMFSWERNEIKRKFHRFHKNFVVFSEIFQKFLIFIKSEFNGDFRQSWTKSSGFK